MINMFKAIAVYVLAYLLIFGLVFANQIGITVYKMHKELKDENAHLSQELSRLVKK